MKKKFTIVFLSILFLGIVSFICYGLFGVKTDETVQVYAKSISIANCPRQINLYIKNQIELDENFCTVLPENYNLGIRAVVLDSKYQENDGIAILKNTIIPKNLGCYYIKFSAKREYGEPVSDYLKINVVEKPKDANDSLELNSNYFSSPVGQAFDLSTALSNVSQFSRDIEFQISGKTISSTFSPTEVGLYGVKAYIKMAGYKKVAYFNFEATDISNLNIELSDGLGNKYSNGAEICFNLTDKVGFLTYQVTDSKEQTVMISLSDENIVKVSADAPIIVINLLNVGKTNLIIMKGNQRFELVIIIKE